MEELIKSAVDFLQGRMKDSSFDFFKIEMAFLKEKLAMEVFKGWKVPGKFQLGSMEFCFNGEDMGIRQLIAVVNLGHLSCEPDRYNLEGTLSF
jgi:hypothetical protein